jgi:hypothetical protein
MSGSLLDLWDYDDSIILSSLQTKGRSLTTNRNYDKAIVATIMYNNGLLNDYDS